MELVAATDRRIRDCRESEQLAHIVDELIGRFNLVVKRTETRLDTLLCRVQPTGQLLRLAVQALLRPGERCARR